MRMRNVKSKKKTEHTEMKYAHFSTLVVKESKRGTLSEVEREREREREEQKEEEGKEQAGTTGNLP